MGDRRASRSGFAIHSVIILAATVLGRDNQTKRRGMCDSSALFVGAITEKQATKEKSIARSRFYARSRTSSYQAELYRSMWVYKCLNSIMNTDSYASCGWLDDPQILLRRGIYKTASDLDLVFL
jgi:hypothetical protein